MRSIIKKIIPAATAGLLCSCQSTRIDMNDPGSGTDDYYDTPLWSIAVSYPDGYDWMKDPSGGNVASQILVFRENTEVMRLDASADGPLRPESDLHNMIDGHLYSHAAMDDGTTVMLVDGQEKFRFEGRESIDKVTLENGDILTLGQSVSGSGWSFRRNGELVFGQDNGVLKSSLYEDEGELCFSWASPISSSSGQTAFRYYSRFGEKRSQLLTSADISGIYSIRRHNGQLNWLASSNVIDGVLWENGEESICISGTSTAGSTAKISDASLLVIGDRLCAHLIEKISISTLIFWVESWWDRDGMIASTGPLREVCSKSTDAPCLYFATRERGCRNGLRIWKNGNEYSLPEECFMVSPASLCCNGKYHYIGLNDGADSRKRPLLIHRGDTSRFDFNGFFTELSLP